MKILIPTYDCLTIAPNFANASSFRLQTIINGSIKEDSFITLSISIEAEKNLQKINFEVFHTEETNFFNALISYMKNHATMERHYYCCP